MRIIPFLPLLVLVVSGGACATKQLEPSVVTGTAALSTFSSKVTSVAAIDELGGRTRVALGGDASFRLPLAKGHTYKLEAVTDKGAVHIAYPRAHGGLDVTFALRTDGAVVRLGTVRYLSHAPAGGFRVLSIRIAAAKPDAQSNVDCVDCVTDDSQTACGSGGPDEQATEAEPMPTKAASARAEQADPNQELAVGEQNAPETVDGCDSQEGDNVDLQQEGEH